MANVTNQIPWILDSTGAATPSGDVTVRALFWSGATINASLNLKDVDNAAQMFAVDALYANVPPFWVFPLERPLAFAGGINVATISSGRLFVYRL